MGLVVCLLSFGAFIYTAGCMFEEPARLECFGPHWGIGLDLYATGFHVCLGWGWPRKGWVEYKRNDGGWLEIGHECFGFLLGYRRGQYYGNQTVNAHFLVLGIPWWFLVALPLAARLEPLASRFARPRVKTGFCSRCGYDLRATPARCPECGAACKAADPAGASPAAGD